MGWPSMAGTIVGTLDGAPMVRRQHHLEKAIAAIGISLKGDTWRQLKLNHQQPVRQPLGMTKRACLS